MTPRNFPPADQCSPEDLDAIADLVVRDPSASYDLAGSREHIEALCRRYQALVQDLESARKAIADREDEIARVNNERQAEVNEAAAQRERADEAERRLEAYQQTAAANDRIRSAFASAVPAICGVTMEELDAQLDEELAAHPDVGPLHHARDQRDHQEDTTP